MAGSLSEVELVEVGPTLKGANPEAQLQAVKTALREANGAFPFYTDADREYDEEFRKRMRSRERDRELEEMIERYGSKKPSKPITVKNFWV